MTLHEFIFETASESLLHELAEDDEYWDAALTFVGDNADRVFRSMSPRQRTWAERIKADLIRKAQEQ